MEKRVQAYSKDGFTVYFDPNVCMHSAKCVNGLPSVFDISKKRWINVKGADREDIMTQIDKCPSGALSYAVEGGNLKTENKMEETTDKKITITATKNGWYEVDGEIELIDGDGNLIETKRKAYLCRCGASKNKPFCDSSHKKIGFVG